MERRRTPDALEGRVMLENVTLRYTRTLPQCFIEKRGEQAIRVNMLRIRRNNDECPLLHLLVSYSQVRCGPYELSPVFDFIS